MNQLIGRGVTGVGVVLLAMGAGQAQDDAPKPATPAQVAPARATDEQTNPVAKPTEFSDVGAAIAAPALKTPAGAEIVRQVSAPIGKTGDTVLLNWYKRNGVVFMDILTSKNQQAWTPRNHVRITAPLPLRPEKMTVTMRSLDVLHRKGFLIVANDEAGSFALALPKGFGGTVMQQLFATAPTTGTHRAYDFSQADSRGFVLVKATVESSGQVKASDDVVVYVWNGKKFIQRKSN